MQNGLLICLLLVVNGVAVSADYYSRSGPLGGNVTLRCMQHSLEIYVSSAKFGYLGEDGGQSCSYNVGKFVRFQCNKKNKCLFRVLKSNYIKPQLLNCSSETPKKLYVEYECLNRGASFTSMRDVARKKSGYLQPTRTKEWLTSETVRWKYLDKFCKDLPRYIHFKLIDLNLLGCEKQSFTIKVTTAKGHHTVRFCHDDLDDYNKSRSFGFSNFSEVTFDLQTKNTFHDKRGFLMKFISMQCNPIMNIPRNAEVEYYVSTGSEKRSTARISCKPGFVSRSTSKIILLECGGAECFDYDCELDPDCDPRWKPTHKGLHTIQCDEVQISTTSSSTTHAPTTTPTTTTPTTATVKVELNITSRRSTVESIQQLKTTTDVYKSYNTTLEYRNSTNATVLHPVKPIQGPKRRPPKVSQLVIVAGTVGGVAGFMVCLILGVLLLMICKQSRSCSRLWCCSCLDGCFYSKSDLSRTQSHLVGSVDDSTMAIRYRVPTASTTLDGTSIQSNNNRASLAASSTIGSLSFASYRRNKKKPVHPLPHPSQLGYGPYDEMAPLCQDNGNAWSPSVETYLEPNRRPSASSLGATGTGRKSDPNKLGKFHPKNKSSTEYQVYDENRSSRMALDRFDGLSMDPRRSQALQSNHYYCRDDRSVDDDQFPNKESDCESVYESVDDALSSVSSGAGTPHGGRRFPTATRNEYVQPPELPERPPGMDRSSNIINILPDEEDDGYQPVNVKGRMNV